MSEAVAGRPRRLDDGRWEVPSSTGQRSYIMTWLWDQHRWQCSCQSGRYRPQKVCRHLAALSQVLKAGGWRGGVND
jgi:hypothetical protein